MSQRNRSAPHRLPFPRGIAMLRSGVFSVSLFLLVGAAALADPAPAQVKVPKQLLKKRLEAARKVYEQTLSRIKGAQGLPSELFGWSDRWCEPELALTGTRDARIKALKDHLDRTRDIERIAIGYDKAGQRGDVDAANYYRLDAEIRLLKEGGEPHPAKSDKKPDKK